MLKAKNVPILAAIAATEEGLNSDKVRKIVAKVLNKWPGMEYDPGALVTDAYRDPGKIILPLTQEPSDD